MQLGWVDYSEYDRQMALRVMELARDQSTVDELGIGIIRDAFSDRLFPGMSTLITKAKYYFIVPYILQDIEARDNTEVDIRQIRDSLHQEEKRVAERLVADANARGVDTQGIVGNRALKQGKWVDRNPSVIYWTGLCRFGLFRREEMSLADYLTSLVGRDGRRQSRLEAYSEDGETSLGDDDFAETSNWNLEGLRPSGNWIESCVLELTNAEASLLCKKMRSHCHGSLLAMLLDDLGLASKAIDIMGMQAKAGRADSAFRVFFDEVSEIIEQEDDGLAAVCKLAVNFSNFNYVCRVAYNVCINPDNKPAWDELVANDGVREYEKALDRNQLFKFTAQANLQMGRMNILKHFFEAAANAMKEEDLPTLCKVVTEQEKRIKPTREKIGHPERCDDAGWYGGGELSYRFGNAVPVIREIRDAGGFDA